MEFVLDLQDMQAAEMEFGGGSGHGGGNGSTVSLVASCENSNLSLMTCH